MTQTNCTDFLYFFSFFVFQLSEQNKKLVEAIGKRRSLDAETFKKSVLKLMSEMAPSALKTEMLSVAEIEIERNMSVQRALPSMQSEIVDLSANQPIVEAAANATTTSTTNEGGSGDEGKKSSKKRSPSAAVEQAEKKKAAKAKKKASKDDSQNVQNAAGDIQGDTISPEGEEGSEKPSGNEKNTDTPEDPKEAASQNLAEEEEIELMQILIGDADNLDSAESQQGTAKRPLENEGDENEPNKKQKTN